jgi:hypothetical protein
MPTYTYKSITSDKGQDDKGQDEIFEVHQSMRDPALTHHPETGVPVQRIISGGAGILGRPMKRSTVVNKSLAAATPCGCSKQMLSQMMRPKNSIRTVNSSTSCNHKGHTHKH